MPQSLAEIRKDHPHLKKVLYFNNAAASLMPRSVQRACCRGVELSADLALGGEPREQWARFRTETRAMTAELIGAAPQNVAFTNSTSTALSLISLAIPWRRGDNVVTGAVENPATVVPWQNLAHLGVQVRFLPADRDDLMDAGALAGLIDRRTRLVALSLVQYSTGQRLAFARAAELCRRRGALLSADAVQAAGAVPIDVGKLGVHFLSFGAQKWMLGPRHIAAVYVDPAVAGDLRSPIVTEGNVADIGAEEEQPTRGVPMLRTSEGARKLEALPYYNCPGVCGLHQALRNLRAVGAAVVHRRLRAITDELVEGLRRLGGRVVSPRGEEEWSGIVSWAPDSADPRELVSRLRERDVYVALRKGRLRVSPHYYNTSDEVREFLSILGRLLRPRAASRPDRAKRKS